jgi:hypothetical protein
MSRSRRKTPIFGITTAKSDKEFKVREHRRARRAQRQGVEAHPKACGDPWKSVKDGKQYWPEGGAKAMRK